jgi:riboflavin kinase/FMN adenylyltransferase
MLLLNGFTDPDAYRGGFLSIGNFDGVHRGHQEMLGRLVSQARNHHAPTVVMTFEPHPLALIAPERLPPQLTTIDEKARLLAQLGVDCLIAYPTDTHLLQLTAEEFFARFVRDQIAARGMMEGPNFCFGRGRKGTIETLKTMCSAAGVELTVCEMLLLDGQDLSSTAVRTQITEGRLADARTSLARPYRISGKVISGAQRGRTIGFPTANLDRIETLVPQNGVYAAVTEIDGRRWPAAMNIGPNPTFGENAQKVEVHVIDFHGDLYGRHLDIDILHEIRGVQRFESVDQLKAQLTRDIETARVAASNL